MTVVTKEVRTNNAVELMELNDRIIDVLGQWTVDNGLGYEIAIDQASLTIKVTITQPIPYEQTIIN
jgi:hypothetical protein